MKKFSFNLTRHCLIPGIIMMVLGTIGSIVYQLLVGETRTMIESNSFTDNLINEMPLLMLIMLLIFAPIVEEFCFRSWTMKSKFWKYFSLIGITAYSYTISYSIILTCVVFVVLLLLFCIIKGDKHKDLILFIRILVTSILFSLAHYQNESGWLSAITFFDRLGFALLACYIALRFRFIYAILLHFANNLLVFALSYFFVTDCTFEIKDETHTAQLTKTSIFEGYYNYSEDGYCVNKIVNIGCLPSVAYDLVEDQYQKDIMYFPIYVNYNHYQYCATATDSTPQLNYWQLFDELVQQTGLKLDTIKPEKIYHIEITDTTKLLGKGTREDNMGGFVQKLRGTYGKMFVIDDGIDSIKVTTDRSFYTMMNMEKLVPHLKERYGFKVEERDNQNCKIIYISEP